MNYRPLALMIGALALTPLSTIAAPPPWAGGAKASQNAAGGEQHRQYLSLIPLSRCRRIAELKHQLARVQ